MALRANSAECRQQTPLNEAEIHRRATELWQTTKRKALVDIYDIHDNEFKHQACAMWFNEPTLDTSLWPVGYSHIDRNGRYWSGNLRGWVQFRKMIPNEAKW